MISVAECFAHYKDQIDAVIFDCDGVLVDTEPLKYLSWRWALAQEGIRFTLEQYKSLVGNTSLTIVNSVSAPIHVIELFKRNYEYRQKREIVPIAPMVSFAKGLTLPLGLASSAPREEILYNLTQTGLESAFTVIISGHDDLGDNRNKPKPDIYLEAASRLKVSPSRCLVFEDSAIGIEAASSAGTIAIAVPNAITATQDFSKAAAICCH